MRPEIEIKQLRDKLTVEAEVQRKLASKIMVLEKAAGVHRAAEITAAEMRHDFWQAAEIVPDPPAWINEPQEGRYLMEVPVTIWSDFHWYEVVRNCGGNVFNAQIARKRLKRLVNDTIDVCFHHVVKPRYPGIVICLGGDMITGSIHAELVETNDGTTQQALLDVQDHLTAAITRMADKFGKVFLPCVVGNHGRDTIKPHFKDATFHNYDWALYQQLDRHFRSDPRVQFFIPDEVDASFTVCGHRFLLTHGDNLGVQGGDGIIGAIGPIARGAFKLGRQMRQAEKDFDTLLMGHYHSYLARGDLVPAVCNGSLIGFNEYANLKLRAPNVRPCQALFMIHPKRGFTVSRAIYLEDVAANNDERAWVEVFK